MSWSRVKSAAIVSAFAFAVAEGCANGEASSDTSPAPSTEAGAAHAVGGGPARALVGGATVSTSEHFKAIRTLGQGPGGNGVASSPKNRVQGGLVGATQ
jgi:hypothetical protein